MAGLQGSGKTTNAAKLARWFKQPGPPAAARRRRPPAPGRRRAAAHARPPDRRAGVQRAGRSGRDGRAGASTEARRLGRDVLIVDTAGRLAIDAELMDQVRQISGAVAAQLHVPRRRRDDRSGRGRRRPRRSTQTLALDGVILTKLDGDARGGAALSVKEVVGQPIAFASTGEKLDDFELFHPDRMAGRILGMGDVLTLIEKAEQAFEKEQAESRGREAAGGRVHPRRLPRADAAAQEDGPARQASSG